MSARPLLVTDCDEVLLHMVAHFGDWVREAHGFDFRPDGGDFRHALTRNGAPIAREEMWALLQGFFTTEMDRQTLVPGAAEALERIAAVADVVVLTNLRDEFNGARAAQLNGHGIRHRVVTNQGGKGEPLTALIAEYRPTVTVFVDDLAVHHASVAEHAPATWRLHMVAEPALAPTVPAAPAAHVRIDDWGPAADWILARFADGVPA